MEPESSTIVERDPRVEPVDRNHILASDTLPGGSRFLAKLLDRTTQAFGITDLEGRLIYANPAFEALLGYSTNSVRGRTFREFTTPETLHNSDDALALLHKTGQSQRYEKDYIHRDGSIVPVEMVIDFFLDDDDRAIGYYGFITEITERKCYERALLASEARFRLLYDEAPFGYHEVDLDGIIKSVNRTESEMLGYAQEEMVGRSILDFLRQDHRVLGLSVLRDRLEIDEAVLRVERVFLTKSGEEITMAVENRVSRDHEGNPIGMRSTLRDITERKRAEAALIASERRARALFEGIEDAVFVHDKDGRILDANPAACRRLGYTRQEFLKLNTRDIDDPEFAAGYEERLKTQLAHGHLCCEGRHRTKSGRIIPVDINTSTIQLEDQPAVLAVNRDITERKALEETRREFLLSQTRNARDLEGKNQELARSEARYRKFTEGSLDGVVVADAEGIIRLFNPAAERTFGYLASEVIGQPLTLLIPKNASKGQKQSLAEALKARDSRVVGRTVERTGRRKDGEIFPMEISLSAVEFPDGIQFVGSIRDQTERQRMRDVLAQSERLASIGLLSAGVAHEINNPLAYIANNLAVLERDLKGILELISAYESAAPILSTGAPEAIARVRAIEEEIDWNYVRENLGRMISRTREGVQRVANIVGNLRGLARTAPPKFEPVPLVDLLHQAVEMVQGRLRRQNIELVLDLRPLPKLPCVAPQINQVILNLMVNSIQAIEETDRLAGNRLELSIREIPGFQVLTISDNGVGIPPEALPRLFDPFFTTKPVGEGTGLGLSISHGIVSGHGGRIEVSSSPESGTRFQIFLPSVTSEQEPAIETSEG